VRIMLLRSAILVVAVGCAQLSGAAGEAGEPAAPTARPMTPVPDFGDKVLNGALAKMAEVSELAAVQEEPLKKLQAEAAAAAKAAEDKLAAKKEELDAFRSQHRESLSWRISDLLYPEQIGEFQKAYEELLGSPAGEVRKMVRNRLNLIMGFLPPLKAPEQAAAMAALCAHYLPVQKAGAELEAAYKDRLGDPKAAAEYQEKREALLGPAKQKSLEIVKGLLSAELQEAIAKEWLRRQDRRVMKAVQGLSGQYAPKTDEQKKQIETLTAAMYEASRKMDLDTPEFEPALAKLKADMEAAVK
jgi:hypothetical protein